MADVAKTETVSSTLSLQASPSTSTLETLPAELRNIILSHIVDLSDLRALVHASPVFYQQYRLNRQRHLGQCLKRTLRSVFIDAYIHQVSSNVVEQRLARLQEPELLSATLPAIEEILPARENTLPVIAETLPVIEEYTELHSSSQLVLAEDIALERCSIDDLTNIASFYLSVVQPLMTDFATLFLQNLGTQELPELGSLRNVERTRFLRALYRFQIYQDLFADSEPLGWDDPTGLLAGFFGIFHPWELEEVYCIDHLVRARHNWVFGETTRDAYTINVGSEMRMNLMAPKREVDPKNAKVCLSIVHGTIPQGLRLFQAISRVAEHEVLVGFLRQNMSWCLWETIPAAMAWMNSDHRRHFNPSHHDQLEDAEQKMPFLGDEENAPPLSWVIIRGGLYSNRYGDHIPSGLRGWGYVFWDMPRLFAKGGEMEALLQSAWLDAWPDEEDPRDLHIYG